MYVDHNVRKQGYAYELCRYKDKLYQCVRCKRHGKSRYNYDSQWSHGLPHALPPLTLSSIPSCALSNPKITQSFKVVLLLRLDNWVCIVACPVRVVKRVSISFCHARCVACATARVSQVNYHDHDHSAVQWYLLCYGRIYGHRDVCWCSSWPASLKEYSHDARRQNHELRVHRAQRQCETRLFALSLEATFYNFPRDEHVTSTKLTFDSVRSDHTTDTFRRNLNDVE